MLFRSRVPLSSSSKMSETELKEAKVEVVSGDGSSSGPDIPSGATVKRGMILTPDWDYVVMFADVDIPQEDGKEVPESHSKYKKWAAIREKRKQFIEKIRRPTAGLTISTRKAGGRAFVLIACSEERLMAEAERIEMQAKLKAEYGGGYDAFEARKKRFYEPAAAVKGETEAPSFFRRLQRMSLIDSIIGARAEDGGCDIIMSRLIKENVVTKFYGLHDEFERSDLLKTWSFKPFKFQDINRIRNYFGEELAFYLAWLGFKTERLLYAMLLGLVVTGLWIAGKQIDSDSLAVWPLTLYSVYLGVWAALFQNYWARYESTLAFRWGVNDLEDSEKLRPEYFGDDREGLYFNGEWVEFGNEETNKISAALSEIITGENPNTTKEEVSSAPLSVNIRIARQPYYSAVKRNLKLLAALPVLGLILFVMVITTISVLTLRLFLQRTFGAINQNLTAVGSVIGGFLNAICIILLNQVYQRLALRLTEWENYRTYSEFANNLTVKMFLFQFVNSYLSLYYMAFFKRGTHLWGSDNKAVWDACKQGNANPTICGGGC